MNENMIDLKEIDNIIEENGTQKENLVSILHAIQDYYNYLPEEVLKYLIEVTEISPRDIEGVATFYSQFRFIKAGQHFINLCIGTACHVKGAEQLFDNFKSYLKIEDCEDTSSDGLFTLNKVACLGCCMLAPAVRIDDITYGPVDKDSIPNVIHDFLNSSIQSEIKVSGIEDKENILGTIKICLCSSCSAAGSLQIFNAIQEIIKKDEICVALKNVACTGISFKAPLMEIEMSDNRRFKYGLVKKENVYKIIHKHFKTLKILPKIKQKIRSVLEEIYCGDGCEPVTRYLMDFGNDAGKGYISCQKQIATKNNGELDPLDLDEYLKNDGFKAFFTSLNENDPDKIIDQIKKSKLRGRGGAGFDTAFKWLSVKKTECDTKYIICNGDEGDPGAFMDRMLLESFPFRIIEGMAIAALALKINNGLFFIRAEYPLAIKRIKKALSILKTRKILQDNLDIQVFVSAGAFVCGEETALIASIHGERGMPNLRPPYPSERGLRNSPTLVNNVETFALIPWIVYNGGKAFLKLGTPKSTGTKTFALAGKIKNGGLIEVEMGTTLYDIVFKIGGGLIDNKNLKAVQIGGPAGGCLPASLIDTKVDYESLKDLGTIMGSGGMIVLDEDDCIVDVAKYFMSFTQHESCGKCTFGRIGTIRMLEVLEKMTQGKASNDDLKKLIKLSYDVKNNSLCGLGRAAPNPVISALKYFENEFLDHIKGKCHAKKCKAFIFYDISDKCIGCTICARKCPSDAIQTRPYLQHEIDQNLCIKCDTCRIVCPQDAVEKKHINQCEQYD